MTPFTKRHVTFGGSFSFEQVLPQKTGVAVMSGKTDKVKGRIKEAAGALTGNDELREEGKTDQAAVWGLSC